MASLAVNFNQLVDLAVDPSLGTINTTLLHNLLHIVIVQLRLSSELIEFHGVGSAAIGNLIANSQENCESEINEYEVKTEVDDASGNIVERREQIQRIESNDNAKIFTIRIDSKVGECLKGYQLNPIQCHSSEDIKELGVDNNDDVMANVISSSQLDENSSQPSFDLINISKRISALEVGIRKLGEALGATQCDLERSEEFSNVTDSQLSELNRKVDNLSDEMKTLSGHCKCTREEFDESQPLSNTVKEKFTQAFNDLSTTTELETNNLKTFYKIEGIENEMTHFKDLVCDRLESYKDDFVCCMTEIQTMLDAKLDKFYVPDLKNYLHEIIHNLEEKIDNVDYPKPLAAGAVKKIFKDLNCVSCGTSVIQADNPNPTQSMLMINEEHPCAKQQQQLLKMSTRACDKQAQRVRFSITKLSKPKGMK